MPTSRVSDTVGLEWGPLICTFNKFQGNADATGPQLHFVYYYSKCTHKTIYIYQILLKC